MIVDYHELADFHHRLDLFLKYITSVFIAGLQSVFRTFSNIEDGVFCKNS